MIALSFVRRRDFYFGFAVGDSFKRGFPTCRELVLRYTTRYGGGRGRVRAAFAAERERVRASR